MCSSCREADFESLPLFPKCSLEFPGNALKRHLSGSNAKSLEQGPELMLFACIVRRSCALQAFELTLERGTFSLRLPAVYQEFLFVPPEPHLEANALYATVCSRTCDSPATFSFVRLPNHSSHARNATVAFDA